MKIILRSIFIFYLFLSHEITFCQDTLLLGKPIDIGEPHDFSYLKKWDYFNLKDTIVVKIIQHLPAPASCGILATASITIAKTEKGDTIRIIDMCNVLDKYKKGQIIRIAPAEKPPFGLTTPFTLKENPKTKKFEPSTFDLTVLKTTWGSLLDQ